MNSTQNTTINFWKSFDLPKYQKELDQVALDIANRQDESDNSRQKLVEQSREFKRTNNEDIRKCVAPLFKNFQQEIDSLSKRSKAAEAAFLSVYKQIIDFADPGTLIDQAEKAQKFNQRAQDLEIENQQLRETLTNTNHELIQAKYFEELCRKLELKLKESESNIQTLTEEITSKLHSDMSVTFSEREKQLLEEQKRLNETITRLQNELKGLHQSFDTVNGQMFDLKSKYDQDLSAKNYEIDMLAKDVEKLNQRSENAERQLRILSSSEGLENRVNTPLKEMETMKAHLEEKITLKDKEIQKLYNEIKSTKEHFEVQEKSNQENLNQLRSLLSEKDQNLTILESKLATMSDYDNIKRELDVFKSMELNEISLTTNGSESESSTKLKEKPLEVVVMEKNRILKNENNHLKMTNEQLSDKVEKLNVQNTANEQRINEQNALIEKLEKDVSALQGMAMGHGHDEMNESGLQSPLSSDLLKSALIPPGQIRFSSMESINSMATADTLLPIVSSQRERFKTRTKELELENSDLKRKLQTTDNELRNLKNDNLMLYEKIRFLQSYKPSTSIGPAGLSSIRERSVSPSRKSKGKVVEINYSESYENRLDPFKDFHLKEKQRKLNSLNPPERIIHFLATNMVSSRRTRFFAFIYIISLHVLVFMVLYHLAWTKSDWAERYTDHMKKFHPEPHMD